MVVPILTLGIVTYQASGNETNALIEKDLKNNVKLASEESISATTEEAAASSQETAATAQSLAKLAEELKDSVSTFKMN